MPELRMRFPKSRIFGFERLVELAKEGAYDQEEDGTSVSRFVVPCELYAVQRLHRLVLSLRRLRGASVEIDGVVIDAGKISAVLDCYTQSLQVSDVRAHCWVVSPRPDGLLWPCRLAAPYLNTAGIDQHPSSRRAQMESALVWRGCAWCPQLRLNEWELEL